MVILSLFYTNNHAQEAFIEMSGTTSNGDYAPLWLSANHHGVVSPYSESAYERLGYQHDFSRKDSTRRLRFSAGADIVLAQNAQQKLFVHQLYGKVTYDILSLTVGQKERSIDLRNNKLTSGGMSQGINAQPIPEALLEIGYFNIPYTKHLLNVCGRIGYGKTTDGSWQEKWVNKENGTHYTSDILYHEKMIGFEVGDKNKFPLVFDLDLQMMTQFGGTSYNVPTPEGRFDIKHSEGFIDFWHALWPMGSKGETDGVIKNAAGNTVGSYNIALTWYGNDWKVRGYFERVFEDQSMMTVQYGIFDHLVGVEAELPQNRFVSHVLIEHMSTKDQAGPLFHDQTANITESYTGVDDYYNHSLYSGWQNYGMGIGHPLLTSPIYNADHSMQFFNNRIRALHLGIDGNPISELSWRLLATWTRNWGNYFYPLDDVKHQQYFMAEATYKPKKPQGWQATLAFGYDHGDLDFIGNSIGVQLTIRKTFKL